MPLTLPNAVKPLNVSPGRQPLEDEQVSFRGGLNSVSADDALAPDQLRRTDNGRLTIFGAFKTRGGTQRTAAALIAATAVQNGLTWNQAAGTNVPMAVAGGTLFTTAYGSFPLTWTQRGASPSMSTSVNPSLAQFISATSTEAVFIADGGALNKYQGTTLTTNIAGTPNCNQLAVHNERLWGCGDPAFPDSIFYSALNNGDSLGVGASSGGQIVVRTFGAENCVTLRSLGTSLMILHRRGLSRLTGYGQSDITVSPAGVTRDVGTIAPFSAVVIDNLMYFVSERGLYAATEADVSSVSSPDQPDPLSIILPQMSAANIALIRSCLNRATRELWIMIPGYGVYVYHTILKAWAGPWSDGYESPETTALFEAMNTDGYPIVLRGDASGFVSECDRPNVFLDNVAADGTGGTSYASTMQCRRFYCNAPHVSKAWRFGYLLGDLAGSNAVAYSWTTDSTSDTIQLPASTASTWGASGTTWGTGTWGAFAQTSYRVGLDGEGYYIDVRIINSGAAAPVLSQVKVLGFALGRR